MREKIEVKVYWLIDEDTGEMVIDEDYIRFLFEDELKDLIINNKQNK